MGTKEQNSVVEVAASATATAAVIDAPDNKNVNTNIKNQISATHVQLPKASPPPQIIIIPATQATTVATNAAKKIRRAFSMPRNPFRWSRKFKTSTATVGSESSNSAITSCVGGGRGRAGSIVSLSSYEAVCKDTNGNVPDEEINNENDDNHQKQQQQQQPQNKTVQIDNKIGNQMATTTTSVNNENYKNNNNNSNNNNNNNNSNNNNNNNNNAAADAAPTIGSTTGSNRVLRRSSFRKLFNRIAQHVSTAINVGANKNAATTQNNTIATSDRVPPIAGYQWPADQTPGVMGLKNHGNTCFMNAVLQCLSHTDILAEYFVLDQYKADLKRRNKINSRKFGTKGELTEQLANVLKALWTCKNESDHSTSFKAVVDRYGSQFRSSTQHDAQEFLFWLLDKVHEDLNTATKRRYKSVKNTYGRPDEVIAAETLANHIRCNNSFVQAVFQAQFRSSLTCPRCEKQSNTFDPFHCISVQLPQLTQQTIFVTVIYLKQHPRQVKLGLTVPAGSPIVALREQLQTDTGIGTGHMVLADINKSGFTRVFYDTQPVETLNAIETIYCIEVPDNKMHTNSTKATTPTETSASSSSSSTTTTTTTTTTARTSAANTNATESSNKLNANESADLLLLVANMRKKKKIPEKVIKDDKIPKTTEKSVEKSTDKLVEKPIEATKAIAEDIDAITVADINETETIDDDDDDDDDAKEERFGIPFSVKVPRDCSYKELQKKLLREMSPILKPEVFSYTKPLNEMFQIRLQDPSADPDTYLEQVEHPLLTEMIDLALSVLSAEAGPQHIKLLLEWSEPEQYFSDLTDTVVEHESVARLLANKSNDTATLSLEQCLEHYTKAETLSAEDAWRCPHCQQYLPVVKTLGLWSLPDILVVHFKRFRQHHEKGANAAKLTTMVKFPLNSFDMSPHLARGFNEDGTAATQLSNSATDTLSLQQLYRPSPWKKSRPGDSRSSTLNSRDNRETRYDLYAVCYHQGDTLETGHYTAACKNPYDRQWYKFDDQRVSKVPNESIQEEIINNEAYMLFYQRRTGDFVECSGSSSNSGDHWVSRIAPPTQLTTAEKLTVTSEKQDEDMAEIPEIAVTAAKSEPAPEKEPVVVNKVIEAVSEEIKEDLKATLVVPTETLAQMVVNKKADDTELIDIDYADADGVHVVEETDVDDLQVLESLAVNCDNVREVVDVNQMFIMDEDVHINEAPIEHKIVENIKAPIESITPSAKHKLMPSFTNGNDIKENGFNFANNGKSSPCEIPNNKLNNGKASNSTSSSSSSLSSRSSPHSLAVSIHGASTLQTKFNGYTASSSSANNNYKEALLSSSLKSNSSSIISAAVAAHSNEFHLTRHHWNGSRSSVSAVENATQHVHQNAHGLNLRHSFSTSSNYKLRECNETLSSMLRNSTNTCSKDTLLFIDQQNHHHHSLIEDDDDTSFIGSRSLWISPVTPHKLITVSPKN